LLKALPQNKYYAPTIVDVTVTKFSTVRLAKIIYSVASRFIACRLRAYIYHSSIELYYGEKLVQTMPKLEDKKEYSINYRHIIGSLVRKPGAFANYCYRDSLFPKPIFRKAYDILKNQYPVNGDKQYLQILKLAAIESEVMVEGALKTLLQKKELPEFDKIKQLLNIDFKNHIPQVKVCLPSLDNYDLLLTV
jgi:hypothetical protein